MNRISSVLDEKYERLNRSNLRRRGRPHVRSHDRHSSRQVSPTDEAKTWLREHSREPPDRSETAKETSYVIYTDKRANYIEAFAHSNTPATEFKSKDRLVNLICDVNNKCFEEQEQERGSVGQYDAEVFIRLPDSMYLQHVASVNFK